MCWTSLLCMRPSPLRHTLAILRTTIGLTQKELAEIGECSTATIQAIELGKLKLSDRLGEVIAVQTGINLRWLLDNDVTKPILHRSGKPYEEGDRVEWQPPETPADLYDTSLLLQEFLLLHFSRIVATALSAQKKGKQLLFDFKMHKAISVLEKQFGRRDKVLSAVLYAEPHRDPKALSKKSWLRIMAAAHDSLLLAPADVLAQGEKDHKAAREKAAQEAKHKQTGTPESPAKPRRRQRPA